MADADNGSGYDPGMALKIKTPGEDSNDNVADKLTSMLRLKNAADQADRENAKRATSPQTQGAFQAGPGAFPQGLGAFGGAPASGSFMDELSGTKPAY